MTPMLLDLQLLRSHPLMPHLDKFSLDTLVPLDTHIVRCLRRLPLGLPQQCTHKIPSWDEAVKLASSSLKPILLSQLNKLSTRKHRLSNHHTLLSAIAAVDAKVTSG